MESTIYLVRHGRPQLPDNEMRFLGRTDLALSAEGRRQAAETKEAFKGLLFDRIVHSGLKRASETAAMLAEGRNIPFEEIGAFREIAFGTWEVRSMKDVAEKEPEAFAARGRDFARFRPPGGENFLDVQQRVWPAFFELLDREKGDLLIVAHAGVFKTIIFTLLELSWQKLFSIRQDYCGVHVLSRYEEHLSVKQLNWTPRIGG
jgi:broad specificity phosphatase PhoE